MERKRLLYLVSSDPLVSPFDVNMAYDAGFDAVIPYDSIDASSVVARGVAVKGRSRRRSAYSA